MSERAMDTQLSTDLAEHIRRETGENVFLCYQCVKCTSGCPLAEYFDLAPNQVMRAAQLGLEEIALTSKTPWLCASCQTCTTRCPQGIDVARVMDFMASEALAARRSRPKCREVALFNKVFLRNVDLLGRAYELGLMAEMNLRTRQPFKDVDLGLDMFARARSSSLPEVVRCRRKHRPRRSRRRPPNEIGYYPGCSLHSMAEEFDHSTRRRARGARADAGRAGRLGVLRLVPGAPRRSPTWRSSCRWRAWSLLEQMGLGEVTLPCAMCFNRFRAAPHDLRLRSRAQGNR